MTAHSIASLHPLYEQQLALEEEMIGNGKKRFFAAVEKAKKQTNEAGTGYGALLMKRLIDPITAGIEAFIEEAGSGRAGPKHRALAYIQLLEPEVVSYLALKSLLDTISRRSTIQRAALRIANALQDEVLMSRYKQANKKEHGRTMEHLKESTSTRHKRTVARLMAKNKAGVTVEWSDTDKVLLGTKLCEIIRATTGLIAMERDTVAANDTPIFVQATEDTLAWIGKASDALSLMSPAYVPTIIPPKPWTSPTSGGYWSPDVKRVTFVKTRNKAYLEELEGANPLAVYASVNAMQETPWRINAPVLEALQDAWELDLKIKGFPQAEKLEAPEKPHDIETNKKALKRWKKKQAKAHKAERKRKSKRIQLSRTLDLAVRFSQYPAIYFPHSLDFRGRAYAIPMFLNPQGPDATKALLTFAEGKPIGNGVAAGWLAVHGANTFGNDKVDLEERVEWTEKNTATILAVAADPFGDAFEFWSKADKPWQFLAFCFEWAGYQREGFAFVSCLPIGMDGSCNGLQHYSAALRDPVGGAAVNLVPSSTPSDIYAEVAKVTLRYVEAFARPELSAIEQPDVASLFAKAAKVWEEMGIDPQATAERWLGFGLSRKVTKRPVMTLPYGSTQFSCREFIEDAVRELIEEEGKVNTFASLVLIEGEEEEDEGLFKASLWLQPLVWHAIGEVVQAARIGMDWLKECAKLAAAEGLPIYWRTADGFPVMQAYPETNSRRVKTHIDGQMVRLSIREELETIDKRSQQQGIAPNWVHSQDATALRMFVNLARENGIRHFALVHDSYGTVAADVDMMGSCLRRAFVRLYTDFDPLAEFRVDIAMLLSEEAVAKLPAVPPKGTLDVSLVELSDFFFA
ncbi:DNA-directed RNA polymerase [Bosea sp. MMO-172]|uniref:DNA-directed RNA polymerase n=1 Tax=Bosea sp. MMO-172 TaxID=3127885 RepID=UPI003016D681